jgi:hypothetical protein
VAMYMSISASALGIAEHQDIKISMYLRILIPIVFSRYVMYSVDLIVNLGSSLLLYVSA